MTYTINDIAKLCNVGKSTVSRVLNNDANVNAQTRLKIQAVIDELGFQPNRSARAMRGMEERVVGIIVTRLDSPAESETLSAMLETLHQHNITPLIVESQFQIATVKQHLKLFKQRQMRGVILFAFSGLNEEDVLGSWRGNMVTLVKSYSHFSSVFYDDENAVQTLLMRFYQQGYRHIAYLGVNEQDETTGKLRNQRYRRFCQEWAMPCNMVLGNLSAENAYQNMPKLLEKNVDAVVCASSSLAAGAFKFLQKNASMLPLACIGRNEWLQYLAPEIYALDFGYSLAGKWAVEMLVAQLEGNNDIVHRNVSFHFQE